MVEDLEDGLLLTDMFNGLLDLQDPQQEDLEEGLQETDLVDIVGQIQEKHTRNKLTELTLLNFKSQLNKSGKQCSPACGIF